MVAGVEAGVEAEAVEEAGMAVKVVVRMMTMEAAGDALEARVTSHGTGRSAPRPQ